MFLLYNNEKVIAEHSKKIIDNYDSSSREKKKKLLELFHLLVFLEITNLSVDKIIPNEPGDFIIEDGDAMYMVEVTTVFGKKEENVKINNILKCIFGFCNGESINNEFVFDDDSMRKLFLKKLEDKENKKYIVSQRITKKNLLIVTGEYDNCSITGSWVLKFILENEIILKKTFDKVWVLDYFSSGKDGSPIVMVDFYGEFVEYQKLVLGCENN